MTQCLFQRRALSIKACLQLVLAATSFAGCGLGDDESSSDRTPSSYFDGISDSGYPNRPHDDRDGGPAPDRDASFDASQSDAGSSSVARGRYLVHHVAACVECHTPRDVVGRLDEVLLLSGVECFRDARRRNADASVGKRGPRPARNRDRRDLDHAVAKALSMVRRHAASKLIELA